MNISIRIAVAVLLLHPLMSARDRSNARSMVDHTLWHCGYQPRASFGGGLRRFWRGEALP